MSNRYHVVLYVEDTITKNWFDDEALSRWESLFKKMPGRIGILNIRLKFSVKD